MVEVLDTGLQPAHQIVDGLAVALVEGDRRLSVILDGLPTAGVTGTLWSPRA